MPTTFAQKFTTIGVTGGCRIHVKQDNPIASKGTVPTSMTLHLYAWNTNYTTTIAGSHLVNDYAVVPSEEIESDNIWIFFLWKPLASGTYLWKLEVTWGSDTGVFQVLIDTNSTYHGAYEDGVNKSWDFHSEILGLDAESHEFALSVGDTFTGGYNTATGHSSPKIKRGAGYTNSIVSQDTVVNASGYKIGRIASGSLVKTGS